MLTSNKNSLGYRDIIHVNIAKCNTLMKLSTIIFYVKQQGVMFTGYALDIVESVKETIVLISPFLTY